MDTPNNWDLIQSWVDSCTPSNRSHEACYEFRTLANSDIPSRLIDLEAKGVHQGMRLSLSPKERAPLPYATLSYTWGPNTAQDQLPLLRKNTLQLFSKKIPFKTLPRLFQDVINMARKLKFRYLWIDALCIIQDDERDWQSESAVMGQIYENSTLNIAAGGAAGSHSPLFSKRDPTLVQPCKVKLNWPKDYVDESFYVFGADFLRAHILQTPLNRRGWVVQERLLSHRVLHIGKHQLFWRCDHHMACETFPKEIPNAHRYTVFTTSTDLEKSQYLKYLKIGAWFDVVEAYSKCDLTKESDRLIAMSGIARTFGDRMEILQSSNDAVYFAGLWRSKLIESMLWQVTDGKRADRSPCERSPTYGSVGYVAPSWSWASVRGKVIYKPREEVGKRSDLDCNTYTNLVDILETYTLPTNSQNPYGQLQECHIKLRGMVISSDDFTWTRYTPDQEAGSVRNYNAIFAFKGLLRDPVICVIDDMNDFKPRKTFLSKVGFPSSPGFEFLPLIWRLDQDNNQYKIEERLKLGIPNLEGILVTRNNGEDNEYRRVGYFRSLPVAKHLKAFVDQKRSDILLV